MALTLVTKRVVALAEQLNAYYRVLRGTDPDSIDLRLNGGGHFTVHHSGTNGTLFSVTDAGAVGVITPVDGSVTTAKLADGAVTSLKIADGTIVDADVNAAAAIAVAKLGHVGAGNVLKSNGTANVGGQVVNADVAPAAGVAYSKLNLAASIVNADVAPTAAIALSKLASVSANQIVKDVGSGVPGGGLLVDANVAAAGTANIALGKLAPGSAGVLKSNGTTISAGNLIVTSDMASNSINGDRIADATITGAKITGGAPPPSGSGAPDAWKVYGTDSAGTTVALRQVTGEMFAPGVGMVRIATSGQIASSQATFDFTSIPQTYTALRIYLLARSTASATIDNLYLQVNSLTPGYYGVVMSGSGSTAAAAENTLAGTQFQDVVSIMPAGLSPAGLPGTAVVELPGYASTVFGKGWLTTSSLWFGTSTGQTVAKLGAGFFNVSSGITSIRLGLGSGSFATGSVCALYGIP